MKYLYKILLVCLVAVGLDASAQRDTVVHDHYVGFDANSMLSQVIPFNTFNSSVGFPAIITRRLWNNKGFRSTAGLEIDQNRFTLSNFYFSVGYTSKKDIGEKFSWIRGIDVKVYGSNEELGFFGFGPYWGVEYHVNDVLSLSTESAIQLGFVNDVVLDIRPPVHIQCHFKLK
jgi:hypothetical protein